MRNGERGEQAEQAKNGRNLTAPVLAGFGWAWIVRLMMNGGKAKKNGKYQKIHDETHADVAYGGSNSRVKERERRG